MASGALQRARVHLLKGDVFGYVELLELPTGERFVRRVAAGCGRPGSAWAGRWLLARERRALAALAGLPGVPRLVAAPALAALPGADGAPPRGAVLVRTWLPGTPLHEAAWLPRDFFAHLEALVRRLHERGVCHNDLHKEQNVIVGPDGRPALVDFQLASVHRRRSGRFRRRVQGDLRHVAKHRRRYLRRGAPVPPPDAAAVAVPPRTWTGKVIRRCVGPLLRWFARRVLRLTDTEPRRSSRGPWPAWGPPLGEGGGLGIAPRMRTQRQ